MPLLRRQAADQRDAIGIRLHGELRARRSPFRFRDGRGLGQAVGDEGDGRNADPTPQSALERPRDCRHAAREIPQDAGDHLVQADGGSGPSVAVERGHHRHTREQPGDQRDEQRLEVVRVQETDASLPRDAGDGARAAQVESGCAVELHGRDAPSPRFLREGIANAGAADGAHDGEVGPRRGGGKREDCAVGAVQRRALPQVEDGDHDRAASSR